MVKASLKKSKTGQATTVVVEPPPKTTKKVEPTETDLEKAIEVEAEVSAEEAGPAEPTTTAVAVRENTSGAVQRYHAPEGSGFEGEWGGDDLKFPQLKVVQGSGKLSKEFNIGTVIYAGEELFPALNLARGDKPQALRFVPIIITKKYQQKLSDAEMKAGMQPEQVDTLDQVEAMGGVTRWPKGEQRPDNYWEKTARNLFLIERPEGNDHPAFCLSLDGKDYAVAVYYAAGGSFSDSSNIIYNTAQTSLFVPKVDGEGKPLLVNGRVQKVQCIYKCFWEISWAPKAVQNSAFTPWRPTVRLLSKLETGPDVREYCARLIENSSAVTVAATGDDE